jgi:dTDP-4-amino-4,6-dideoxygalactose transaminase
VLVTETEGYHFMTDADTSQRIIAFSPPDITEEEIAEVAAALRSGWITTGPRTKQLERELKEFTGATGFACLGSATAALECTLRVLGIGPGDEVITSAYSYTASVSPICHVGATPVLCDVEPDTYQMDIDAVRNAITDKTKAIIPVDLGGCMFDYNRLSDALRDAANLWHPANDLQSCFDRCIVIADAAHALGASYHGKPCGSVADFTTFSFHAVKNFTTAEGGGLAWVDAGFDNDDFYHQIMLQSLHGQSKDALAKTKVGAWEYDIEFPGYKCNMTDMQAALGLVQLRRYPALLARRRSMAVQYESNLVDVPVSIMKHYTSEAQSSGHLMLTRIEGADVSRRNQVIEYMGQHGIACNVHYKPLPMMTAYRNIGFDIVDYPHAYAQFENEITLPFHTLLSDDDIDYICNTYRAALESCN